MVSKHQSKSKNCNNLLVSASASACAMCIEELHVAGTNKRLELYFALLQCCYVVRTMYYIAWCSLKFWELCYSGFWNHHVIHYDLRFFRNDTFKKVLVIGIFLLNSEKIFRWRVKLRIWDEVERCKEWIWSYSYEIGWPRRFMNHESLQRNNTSQLQLKFKAKYYEQKLSDVSKSDTLSDDDMMSKYWENMDL